MIVVCALYMRVTETPTITAAADLRGYNPAADVHNIIIIAYNNCTVPNYFYGPDMLRFNSDGFFSDYYYYHFKHDARGRSPRQTFIFRNQL